MYIMCFNVSICFKMGSLYSLRDIITSYCTLQNCLELQDFVLILIKNFLGEDPQTPLSSRIVYYNNNTANNLKKVKNTYPNLSPPTIFLANSRSNGLCMSYLRSSLLIIFFAKGCLKEQRKVLENSLKIYLKSP